MLRILAVCGNGMGSSIVLRLGLEPALAELGLDDTSIECTSVGQAQGLINFADLVIIPDLFENMIDMPEGKPIVRVKNLIDKQEVKEKVTAALEKYYPELLK
jgi:ascorbate PTS system EIIB component